ncbi:MAG TPA: tetratricopeptide repeat protein [Thermoanaerobaculia bacterium]|nr:tetratricopeptide repeat protein [Thermoanaerobaculia bacterium]
MMPSLLDLGFGCFGFIPMVFMAAALIDAFRVRADWYWYMIILGFPIVGSIAYFVVVRSPLLGARNASMMSPVAARRLQARRRLRQLQIQLSHWRGPAVLAEAGEELVVLGKPQEAEKLLRESRENGGAVEDVNLPLAQALEMQGRWAEAVPLLEELCKAEPDARLGEGPLNLGRCLDEAGRKAEAAAVLRKVLERRTVIEAQVRLARILLAEGRKEEARQLLAEVLADAKLLPRYLKREHGAWIRAAARLKSGAERLPRPRFEGSQPPGYRLRIVLGAAAALVALALIAGYAWTVQSFNGPSAVETGQKREAVFNKMADLDRRYPWTEGDDLAKVDLQPADLDRYLAARRNLEPALREVAEQWRRRNESLRTGNVFAMSNGDERWKPTEVAFLQSLCRELERQKLGPRRFENLTNLAEWRFLRRPEALIFGLPEFHRADWVRDRASLDQDLDPRMPEQPASREREQWRRRMAAKIADYERQAAEATGVSPATRALFESRRADLERLNPGDGWYLMRALDSSVSWY